ncbi:hypothetical protein [Xylanimonas sp. McL0601]
MLGRRVLFPVGHRIVHHVDCLRETIWTTFKKTTRDLRKDGV